MRLFVAALTLFLPLTAHGQLVKCVGKDGRVEYATRCSGDSTEVQTGIHTTKEGPAAAPPSSPQQKSLAEREAEFRKRQLEKQESEQKAAKKAEESREKQAACEQARTYLRGLQDYQRIARIDPKTGERVFLEDTDRPAELARAQRAVDSNCN